MTVAGTGALLRFMLRRERRSLPWWMLAAVLFGVQSVGSQRAYDTPEKLAALQKTVGENPALVALSGPKELLRTIGGEATFEAFVYVSIIVALMNMFLIGRNTRADEDTGRAELIRSARVGRRAPLAAALVLAGLSNVAIAVALFVAAAGTGLPVAGSVVLGLAGAGVGVFFAGVAAVAAQVFDHPRAAYGAVGVVLGASFILRAAGDAGTTVLSWLSPIGWAQRTLPFVENRWWPLLLPVAAAAALVVLAVALLDRRDFGAGLVQTRPGPPHASPALGTPLGLAWRLQRGTFVGWAVGLFVLGLVLGSFTESIEQFLADNPELDAVFTGGAQSVVDGYLALSAGLLGLTAGGYGVSAALRARTEEANGRAEPILATRTSRSRWLGSHVTISLAGTVLVIVVAGLGMGLGYGPMISDYGQIPRLIGIALVYAPATCAIVAMAVLGIGAAPRLGPVLGWASLALCAFVLLFSDLVDMPEWLPRVSPFTHTPQFPAAPLTATPLLIITATVALLVAAGFAGLSRRDIGRS